MAHVKNNDISSYLQKAEVARSAGKYVEAAKWYQEASTLEPKDIRLQHNVSKMLIAHYEPILQKNECNVKALNGLGFAYCYRGQWSEGYSYYHRATQISPDSFKAWERSGEALWMLGNYEASLEAYQTALTIKPDASDIYFARGEVYSNLKQYNEAIDEYKRYLVSFPRDFDGHYGLAVAYLSQLGSVPSLKDVVRAGRTLLSMLRLSLRRPENLTVFMLLIDGCFHAFLRKPRSV